MGPLCAPAWPQNGGADEARDGQAPVVWTREEVAVGVSWRLSPRWRLYGEAGLAYLVRSDTQDQWRLQGGAEYEAAPRVFGGRMAWYVGADLSTLEERGWRMDTSVQSGLVTRTNGRAYRLFVEYYDGRARIGHFTAYSEVTLSTGFRVDL